MSRLSSDNSGKSELLQESILDLRKYWDGSVRFIAFADGDQDPDDEPDPDGNEEGDGSSGTGADDKGKGSAKPDVKDPVSKRHAEDAAKFRIEARQAKARADAAEAKLKEITDKDKSATELLTQERDALKAENESLKAGLQESKLLNAFYASDASALFLKPSAALTLMQKELKELKPDEDGDYDTAEIRKIADAFLKENKYLAKTESEDDDEPKAPSGRPSNGKPSSKETSRQVLEKKFPALAGRS